MSQTLTDDYRSIVLSEAPLLDVRAPIEFEKGAFLNAVNIPILDNEERRVVGIKYKEEGNAAAIKLAEQLIQNHGKEKRVALWKAFLEKNPTAYLYCFRGGQRSGISQSWLEEAGIEITRIKGGYKKFRNFLMNESLSITAKTDILILGGRTGSGKTILLEKLNNAIDLEGIANHRGSSFGNFVNAQPAQIDFENNLAYKLIQFDAKQHSHLVIEHEGRNIGRAFIPKPIYENLMNGRLIILETPLHERVQITYNEYVLLALENYTRVYDLDGLKMWADDVQKSLLKIQKRLGNEKYNEFKTAFEEAFESHKNRGNMDFYKVWIEKLLTDYYDPMYDYQLQKTKIPIIFRGNAEAVYSFITKQETKV